MMSSHRNTPRSTPPGARRWPAWTGRNGPTHRLLPDPEQARVRVYSTHSTHKSLSALRQASMIHIRDQDFDRLSRDAFGEAFLTHTSTSPNQQLLASLDLARRQVDIEGFQLVRYAYNMALVFRHRVRIDPLISKWFRILDEADLVPDQYRASGVRCVPAGQSGRPGGVERGLEIRRVRAGPHPSNAVHRQDRDERIRLPRRRSSWTVRHPDQQDLDQQCAADLHDRRHLVQRPLPARRAAPRRRRLQRGPAHRRPGHRALQHRRVEEITTDLPPCRISATFDSAFRPDGASPSATCGRRSTPGTARPTANTSCSARQHDAVAERQDPGVHHLRRPLSAGIPGAGTRSGDLEGNPLLPAPSSTSRRSTATTPNWGCRSSPKRPSPASRPPTAKPMPMRRLEHRPASR